MKIFLSVCFAFVIWIALYKLFFDDYEDFRENAKSDLLWGAFDEFFFNFPSSGLFLIFVAAGILGGALLYNFL